MPHKIKPAQIAKYHRLRRAGHSQEHAYTAAGFSKSYAFKLEKLGRAESGQIVTSQEAADRIEAQEEAERPKALHELDGVAKDCLNDFGKFRARYLGSMSYPWQEEAAETVITHLESEDDSFGVINCPQGSGKTRLFSHDIPAWITARDRSIRGILGSAGLGVSQSMSGNLRDTLERTTPVRARDVMVRRGLAANAEATLASDYGRFKPSASGGLWRRDAFTVEQVDGETTADKESTWAAFSYEAKFLSWRVDFMNWDDLHTSRQLHNADAMEALFKWWDAEAESRLDPGGLCLVTMQRLGANDISRYLLDKIDPEFEVDADRPDDTPKQYFHVVYKAHYDDRCHDDHSKNAKPYPEGCLLQPDRVTWAKIKQKKIAGNYEVVYQQEDTDPAAVLVQLPWVNGGVASDGAEHEGCWDTDRTLGQLPHIPYGSFVIRYMTVDPSPTKWWGIHDWLYVLPNGVEPLAGYRYLINMCRAKMGANEFLDFSRTQDMWVGLAEEWVQSAKASGIPISYLIMEKNAAQRWAMQYEFFNNWAHARSVSVIPHETMANKSDPELGIWNTLPSVYRYGRVRLPAGDRQSKQTVYPLVQEVTTYPNGSTDDQAMSEWIGEYNLQHLVANRKAGAKVHTDMPGWMRER